ncbi:hypothetical protein [Pyrobaculum aerophilum]|uniref:Uncharacterized protein n=1 Tax=Pyrobaculum aerophilum TaxID=13773 RepID=A0A371QUJ1_9CREN|nr:hypothetical protein [Pyrobaculum aerophilum]RFA92826.1 hypothetical protein CGL51_13870 [Pyrobaculum aerophilum]RFA96206.1 hypothetical protein CGL52_11300 [Pyrobaculum aerophilum]
MPPKNQAQIKKTEKPEERKAKKAVVAALFLALLIAPMALAQQAGSDVYNFPFKDQVQNAVKNLAAGYALIFWAVVVLLAIYAAVHWIASPVTWARWSSIINVIDHYKAILIGLAAIPFVLAAFIFAANLITTGYGARSVADAGKVTVDFLNGLLVQSLIDAFGQLKFW